MEEVVVEDITTVTDLKIRPGTTTDTTVRPDITTVGSGAELTGLAQRDITDSLLGLGNPEAERGLEARLLLGRNPSHLHRPPLLPVTVRDVSTVARGVLTVSSRAARDSVGGAGRGPHLSEPPSVRPAGPPVS